MNCKGIMPLLISFTNCFYTVSCGNLNAHALMQSQECLQRDFKCGYH